MPSLLDTVKTGGAQMQMSNQDVSALTRASGSPIAPTTPQDTAAIGGNPDVAKMAGTPNQLQNAVRQMRVNPTGGRDLATAVREAQQQTTQTAEQAQLAQQAKQLGGLGSLQSRVPQLITQAYDKAASQAGAVPLQIDQTQFARLGLSGDALDKAKQALQTLASPNSTQAQQAQATADFLNASGHTPESMTAVDIQHLFLQPGQDEGATLAAAVQGHTPQTLTLDMLQPSQLGFDSWADLDKLLGVQPGAAQKMTVAQLGQAVQALQSGKFNTEAQWRSVLTDPTASSNLRATARTMLQNMGATGMDTAEKSVQKLTQQVQASNTVTFFGQSMTVDQALASDTVKGTIANYLQDPTFAAKVKQQDPNFANWIDQNQQELQTVTANVGVAEAAVAKATADTQAQYGVGGLSDSAIKMLDPNYGQVTSTFQAAPQTVADMSKLPADKQAQVGSVINALANGSEMGVGAAADLMKQFASMGWGALQSYFGNPAAAQMTQENIQEWVTLNTPGMTADSVVNSLAGTADLGGAKVAARTAAALSAMGITVATNPALSALASGDPAQQAAALSKLVSTPTFSPGGSFSHSVASDLAAGTQAAEAALGTLTGMQASIAQTIQAKVAAGGDPKLDDTDVGKLAQEAAGQGAGGNLSSFDQLTQLLTAGGATSAQLDQVTSARNTAAIAYYSTVLVAAGFPAGVDFTSTVTANQDAGTAASYVTSATQALQKAQADGADSSIIYGLEQAVQVAQAAQSQIAAKQAAQKAAEEAQRNKELEHDVHEHR